MAKGKYSPTVYRVKSAGTFVFNAKGKRPPKFVAGKTEWNEELHFANYDSEGFDSYGYSAYDSDGKYVGIGNGIDRAGYTENEYLAMSDEEYEDCF